MSSTICEKKENKDRTAWTMQSQGMNRPGETSSVGDRGIGRRNQNALRKMAQGEGKPKKTSSKHSKKQMPVQRSKANEKKKKKRDWKNHPHRQNKNPARASVFG